MTGEIAEDDLLLAVFICHCDEDPSSCPCWTSEGSRIVNFPDEIE